MIIYFYPTTCSYLRKRCKNKWPETCHQFTAETSRDHDIALCLVSTSSTAALWLSAQQLVFSCVLLLLLWKRGHESRESEPTDKRRAESHFKAQWSWAELQIQLYISYSVLKNSDHISPIGVLFPSPDECKRSTTTWTQHILSACIWCLLWASKDATAVCWTLWCFT